MKPTAGETIGYLFALACIIGGIAGLPWAIGYAADAASSPGWPATEGEILEREVVSSDGTAIINERMESESNYRPHVRYRYSVAGQTYESDQIRLDFYAASDRYHDAFDQLSPYRLNLPVEVYYDPADPANAVLEPGGDWRSYRPLMLGVGAIILGSVTAIYTRRSSSRRIAKAAARAEQKQARAAAKRAQTTD